MLIVTPPSSSGGDGKWHLRPHNMRTDLPLTPRVGQLLTSSSITFNCRCHHAAILCQSLVSPPSVCQLSFLCLLPFLPLPLSLLFLLLFLCLRCASRQARSLHPPGLRLLQGSQEAMRPGPGARRLLQSATQLQPVQATRVALHGHCQGQSVHRRTGPGRIALASSYYQPGPPDFNSANTVPLTSPPRRRRLLGQLLSPPSSPQLPSSQSPLVDLVQRLRLHPTSLSFPPLPLSSPLGHGPCGRPPLPRYSPLPRSLSPSGDHRALLHRVDPHPAHVSGRAAACRTAAAGGQQAQTGARGLTSGTQRREGKGELAAAASDFVQHSAELRRLQILQMKREGVQLDDAERGGRRWRRRGEVVTG